MVVERVEMDAGGAAVDDLAGERGGMGDADVALALGGGLDVERDREVGRQRLAGELEHAAQPGGRSDRHDAGQDRDGHAGVARARDEREVVVGVEEQLGDREGRAGGLLREERVDVLVRMPGARVAVRERGDRDVDLGAPLDARGARHPRDRRLGVRRALGLHPVDELHELRRRSRGRPGTRRPRRRRRADRRAARGSS